MSAKERILDAACPGKDRQPQCEEECTEYIEKHLRHYCKVYMRKD